MESCVCGQLGHYACTEDSVEGRTSRYVEVRGTSVLNYTISDILNSDLVAEKARIISMLKDATLDVSSSVYHRLEACRTWRSLAKEYVDESELAAHTTVLRLLEESVAASPSLEKQYLQLEAHNQRRETSSAAADAAACAIEQGDLEMAVTLLEQGRDFIFRRLDDLRRPADEVRERNSDLADTFEALSRELEELVTGGTSVGSQYEDDTSRYVQSCQGNISRIPDWITT